MAHLQASGLLSQTKFEINHIEITPCPAVTESETYGIWMLYQNHDSGKVFGRGTGRDTGRGTGITFCHPSQNPPHISPRQIKNCKW